MLNSRVAGPSGHGGRGLQHSQGRRHQVGYAIVESRLIRSTVLDQKDISTICHDVGDSI
jgi:hypothetical protein